MYEILFAGEQLQTWQRREILRLCLWQF